MGTIDSCKDIIFLNGFGNLFGGCVAHWIGRGRANFRILNNFLLCRGIRLMTGVSF
jgi:hypothetical protein